jgi:hypothetical protein
MLTHRVLGTFLVVAALAASVARPALAVDRKAAASQAVTLMAKGDFATLIKSFDDTMKQKLPEAKVRETWNMVIQKAGAFKRQNAGQQQTVQQQGKSYDLVTIPCDFEKGPLDVRVVYNSTGQIAGLFIGPHQ